MDFGDLVEDLLALLLVAVAAVLLVRVGWALVRITEGRFGRHRGFSPEAEGRLLLLEEECTSLRRDLTDLKDRQDFTEGLFLSGPTRRRLSPPPPHGSS
jgi:hypothetical protein